MEPLSLIVAALLAGAAAAAKDTTSTAIKDGYQGLKVLIERKLAGQPAAVKALAAADKDPNTKEALLRQGLQEAGADQDAAILQAARALLERTGAVLMPAPVIQQTISNVGNAAISGSGDASLTIHHHG